MFQNIHTTLSARFPSKKEIYLVFAACVFPIHLWAIIVTIFEVPALIKRANILEIFSVFAYVLAITLLESLILLCFLVVSSLMLPQNIFRDRFIASSTIFAFITSIWVISLHFQGLYIQNLYLVPYVLILLFCFILIYRFKNIEKAIITFVDKLTPLSYTYVFLDIVGILIIIFRNLFNPS